MTLEDFIIATTKVKNVDELFSLYQHAMAQLGFDRLIFSLMTEHVMIGRPAGHGIISNYPDDWMAYYTEKQYEDLDPVRGGMFSTFSPFVWEDMEQKQPLTRQQASFMHEGKEAGLKSGVGIPLRGANGAIAGVGAASSQEGVDLDPVTLSKAHLLSTQFYTAFLYLEGGKSFTQEPISISDRERDVLQWTARGKTRAEIAIILGISPSTVNIHVNNILKKFDTNNIAVAAFKAMNMYLIQI